MQVVVAAAGLSRIQAADGDIRPVKRLSRATLHIPPTNGRGQGNASRTNWCGIQEKIINGEIEFREALAGTQVRFAHWNQTDYFNVDTDGYIREDDPGMHACVCA